MTAPSSTAAVSAPARAPAIVAAQEVLKCKWATLLLALIAEGVARPSALQRQAAGISHKVLHQRLAKLLRLGLVGRDQRPGAAAHVEYRLTAYGRRFSALLDALRALDSQP